MDSDGVGDGGHIERAEGGGAESHEVLLTFDDFFGDALDGLLALVDAADEEFARADFVADVAADVVAFAGFGHDVLVEIADAEAGELAFVHGDGVAAGLPFDVDVWGDELARGGAEGACGARVELSDDGGGAVDVGDIDGETAGDVRVAFVCEVVEVLGDDAAFETVFAAVAFELEEETFAEVFCADAWGVEGLEDGFGGFEVGDGDAEFEGEVTGFGAEEAAVVETADEHFDETADFGSGVDHGELLDEVILERDGSGEGVEEELAAFFFFCGAWAAGGVALGEVGAPFLVHLGELAEFLVEAVVEFGFRAFLFEGDVGGFGFEDWVLRHFEIDHLSEFEDGRLQNVQTLLQLRGEPLLLAEVL